MPFVVMTKGIFVYLGEALAKKKVYLVETKPGQFKRFDNWPDCQAFVRGKPFAFAGGETEAAAKAKLLASKKKKTGTRAPKTKKVTASTAAIPKEGICSDAGTHGNPGPCEFQVTDLDGNRLLHKHLGTHTNNYAELAGIGAMVQYAIANNETQLYTDSKIAMIWIEKGRLGPNVHEAELLMKMIVKIRSLLAKNPQLKLLKWHTKTWGEIPADFGRK